MTAWRHRRCATLAVAAPGPSMYIQPKPSARLARWFISTGKGAPTAEMSAGAPNTSPLASRMAKRLPRARVSSSRPQSSQNIAAASVTAEPGASVYATSQRPPSSGARLAPSSAPTEPGKTRRGGALHAPSEWSLAKCSLWGSPSFEAKLQTLAKPGLKGSALMAPCATPCLPAPSPQPSKRVLAAACAPLVNAVNKRALGL
mmetsp:Transcript_47094/g.132447  ORF Transcript_47094/g.132447 Transcript_47094/m.132447 type:complete len:202 (+) Transcript_47094:162-767(+)